MVAHSVQLFGLLWYVFYFMKCLWLLGTSVAPFLNLTLIPQSSIEISLTKIEYLCPMQSGFGEFVLLTNVLQFVDLPFIDQTKQAIKQMSSDLVCSICAFVCVLCKKISLIITGFTDDMISIYENKNVSWLLGRQNSPCTKNVFSCLRIVIFFFFFFCLVFAHIVWNRLIAYISDKGIMPIRRDSC